MSCPGHIKLTLTAVITFSYVTRFYAYLLAGKARKRKSSENEGEDEAEDEGGEEGDAPEESEEDGDASGPAPADE